MLNALIVVWRESLEAMLVIGVLLAWIGRQSEPAPLRRGIWLGLAGGLGLALLLAYATYQVQSQLGGAALDRLQAGMVLCAALLIVQMVLWMRRHGRHMKRQLEEKAGRSAGPLGMAAITALAVAREGAETVVFLFGQSLEASGSELAGLFMAAGSGLALAAAVAWLTAKSARFLNLRTLFRVSEILLLLVAGALLAGGVDRLIALDWLPPLLDPVWDSSALLDDGRGLGRIAADFLGYRARPSASLLLAFAAYWSFIFWRLAAPEPQTRGAR